MDKDSLQTNVKVAVRVKPNPPHVTFPYNNCVTVNNEYNQVRILKSIFHLFDLNDFYNLLIFI